MKEHKETRAIETRLGILEITYTYRSYYDPITGQEYQRDKVGTELQADWLTEEMANEYAAWVSGGYVRHLLPSWLMDLPKEN